MVYGRPCVPGRGSLVTTSRMVGDWRQVGTGGSRGSGLVDTCEAASSAFSSIRSEAHMADIRPPAAEGFEVVRRRGGRSEEGCVARSGRPETGVRTSANAQHRRVRAPEDVMAVLVRGGARGGSSREPRPCDSSDPSEVPGDRPAGAGGARPGAGSAGQRPTGPGREIEAPRRYCHGSREGRCA